MKRAAIVAALIAALAYWRYRQGQGNRRRSLDYASSYLGKADRQWSSNPYYLHYERPTD